jgi:hypothetical protein
MKRARKRKPAAKGNRRQKRKPSPPPPRQPPTADPSAWRSDDSAAAQVPIDTAARHSRFVAGTASGEARTILPPAKKRTIFENKILKRPADIRHAARALAKAIKDQVAIISGLFAKKIKTTKAKKK